MAMHVAFPYVDILRYGGEIPHQEKGTAEFACPDVDTLNVFKIERVIQKNFHNRIHLILQYIFQYRNRFHSRKHFLISLKQYFY